MRQVIWLAVLIVAAPAVAGTVLVSPSATVIPKGGSIVFTVSISPAQNIQSVTLTYGGEPGQDVLTTAPYMASKQFNTPGLDKQVTATVTYTDGSGPDQGSVTVDVVALSLTGPATVLRGWPASYTVKALPAGTPMDPACEWTYNSSSHADTDKNDTSTWAGTMVESGTIHASATVMGLVLEVQKPVTVNARNWTTPITCAQDNEANYGDVPVPYAPLGMNRDRDSNVSTYIFVPRVLDDFSGAVSRACVASGPCQGRWYVTSTSLKCERETVISKYIKPGGPQLGGNNFFDVNDGNCFDAADYLQAIKNHEYRGTPDTPRSHYGHQGRIESAVLDYLLDPRKQIEPMVASTQNELLGMVNTAVNASEAEIVDFAGSEWHFANGPNWGLGPTSLGVGGNNRWMGSYWSGDCSNEEDNF